jgi:hypothetical protein
MNRSARLVVVPLLAGLAGLALGLSGRTEGPRELPVSAFAVSESVLVPVDPERAFDLFTGDVLPWWDHHFSERPHRMVLEPKPGGGFYELFDERGNGALHATVTLAKRGEELQFRGPLGFASLGVHFDMVHRVRFVPEGEGTRVSIDVHGLGEVQAGWPESVQRVWKHFLDERYRPYVEERAAADR